MAEPEATVVDLTTEEYEAFLTAEINRWEEGVSLPEFIESYRANRLDDSDPEVARLVALIGLGQNGR